ncbi:hypothetical protein M2G94_04575 [Vibrio vulnificus]|nr:hypothetical protein [Vibrio vulnificus]
MTPQQRYFKKAEPNDVLMEMIGTPSDIDFYTNTFHYYIKVLATDEERQRVAEKCSTATLDQLLAIKMMTVPDAIRELKWF